MPLKNAFCFKYVGKVPSVNHIYGTAKFGKRFLLPEVKKFKEILAWEAVQAMLKYDFKRVPEGRGVEIIIEATVGNPDRDIDNIPNCIFNALKKVVFEDDKQVEYYSIRKIVQKDEEDELFILINSI